MTRLIIHGSEGRMGQRIGALASNDERFEIVALVDVHNAAEALSPEAARCDVVVDFSSPVGAVQASEIARAHGAALLVGTTGLPRQTLDILEVTARSVAVMIAPNTSLGVAVLNHVCGEAARLLGDDFDIDIIEIHHTQKRDAPSGTALRLARGIEEKAGVEVTPEHIHSLRAGEVVGEHVVTFCGPAEQLRFFHMATSRDVFAAGALRAAAWLAGQPTGRYTVEHALGLVDAGAL